MSSRQSIDELKQYYAKRSGFQPEDILRKFSPNNSLKENEELCIVSEDLPIHGGEIQIVVRAGATRQEVKPDKNYVLHLEIDGKKTSFEADGVSRERPQNLKNVEIFEAEKFWVNGVERRVTSAYYFWRFCEQKIATQKHKWTVLPILENWQYCQNCQQKRRKVKGKYFYESSDISKTYCGEAAVNEKDIFHICPYCKEQWLCGHDKCKAGSEMLCDQHDNSFCRKKLGGKWA
jgi:hypothetical protein